MHRRLMALVAATFLSLAMIVAPGSAQHRASPDSQATITVEDCVVESSKDISYVAFFSDGDFVEKDEDVDAESFDLTGVDGIEDADSIEVKSGTTVETFSIDCVTGETAGDDVDEGDGDGTDEDGTDEDGEDGDERARGNSAAVITLGDDCVLESSKDISYVAFFSDGEFVEKIEDIDSETYDLTTYNGIEDIDAVDVKSGTTVETFSVDCPAGDTAGDDVDEGDDEDGTEDDDTTEPDEGDETDEPDEGDGAVITLSGCVVESTKDISYVAYFSNGEFVEKDESMNSESFDLNSVEGIEDIDSIEVKSSTTVESFAIDCPTGDTTGDGEDGSEDDGTTEPDEGDEPDEPDEGDGTDEPDEGEAAVITLSGCVVESTKDISYVAFFSNGEFVEKDESMNSESFDLNSVEGIEDIDSIEVKSSTTVESFAIDCGPDDTSGDTDGDSTGDDADEESTDEPEAEPDDEEPTEDESTDDDSTDDPEDDDSEGDEPEDDAEEDADDDVDDEEPEDSEDVDDDADEDEGDED